MDAELKKKWVEALRSGNYEQGRQYLRSDGDKFCCLGVLCDLVAPDDWDTTGDPIVSTEDGEFSFPGPGVLEAVGVSTDISGHHVFWPLAHMNDAGKSFAEIADYIEANL